MLVLQVITVSMVSNESMVSNVSNLNKSFVWWLKQIKARASSYSPEKLGGSLSFEAWVEAAGNFARSKGC